MKIVFQEKNNGNGKLTLTADNLKFACAELGISDDKHTLRRAARGFDLYYSGKVEHINDHTFLVESQYNRQRPYQVKLHEGATKTYGYCTCQDWMNYSGDMDVPNVDFWCKHMISSALWLHNNGNGNGTKVVSDCGTEYAKDIQDKLNGKTDNGKWKASCGRRRRRPDASHPASHAGNGAQASSLGPMRETRTPSPTQLEMSDPFQESELRDIDQIEGRRDGELVHKLSNGEYVISYRGIMRLAERHDIEFELATHDETHTIIAKGRRNGSERVSGKPINGSVLTAGELAKRNAARQLIPFAEIKVLELKAKLEADFDWQKAKAKCLQYVTDDNLSIIIHELVKAGDLRQDNPSHYNRIEWRMIYVACQKDNNDGGDNSPPSPTLDPRKASFTHRTLKSVNNWSYNSPEFISKCRDAIQKVRDDKVEANEMPLQKPEGKRKLQMDSKLRTFLIETDGTKKAISCREICEKFESNIVTRLRAGIDSGADLSTVELDD